MLDGSGILEDTKIELQILQKRLKQDILYLVYLGVYRMLCMFVVAKLKKNWHTFSSFGFTSLKNSKV